MMSAQVPWYDAYPKPSTTTPPTISRETLLAWIKEGRNPGQDFLVVDLRRTDHTVRNHFSCSTKIIVEYVL
jgi:arsenical-resistance protein 2